MMMTELATGISGLGSFYTKYQIYIYIENIAFIHPKHLKT